ncbi:MAG: diguanylate cyclase [Kosmotogaceae bacterium]|nr:diguanylate cyclase [Kosmotogaceae bacterium]
MRVTERESDEGLHIARALLEGNVEACAIVSSEGRIIVANSTWERLASARCDELSFLSEEFGMKQFSGMLDGVSMLKLEELLSGKTEYVSFDLNDFENTKGLSFTIVIYSLEISERFRYFVSLRDNSESTVLRNALRDMIYIDSLSGFGNERSLARFLSRKISSSKEDGACFSIVCTMLSDSKEIAAMFGKRILDTVLQKLGKRITFQIKEGKSFRIMDDVFVTVLDCSDRSFISRTISAITSDLEKPIAVSDTDISPSIVSGICQFPIDGERSESLLSNCLTAIFTAKREGLKWGFYG